MGISKSGCSTSITKSDLDAQYKNGFATGTIIILKQLREELCERRENLRAEYEMCEHNAICNRISELNDIIEIIEKKVYNLSPSDCDW